MDAADYQLIILGGGPAGLTAGIYAARARLRAVLIEKGASGGQALLTDRIDNYPGFPEGINGTELVDRMAVQAARFELQTRIEPVVGLDLAGPVKRVLLADGGQLTSQSVIIATGARPNQLGVPGEAALTGRGVSYCATCDGPFFKGEEIVVVGGGDTAIQEADLLTRYARKVTVVHRRVRLRATRILREKAFANPRIEFIWNSVVTAIEGQNQVEAVRLRRTDGRESQMAVSGVFVLIGTIPNNEILPLDQLKTDTAGFILTDGEMRTNLAGVMAAGDIRSKRVRQVVNAAGEGAVAAVAAVDYLDELG